MGNKVFFLFILFLFSCDGTRIVSMDGSHTKTLQTECGDIYVKLKNGISANSYTLSLITTFQSRISSNVIKIFFDQNLVEPSDFFEHQIRYESARELKNKPIKSYGIHLSAKPLHETKTIRLEFSEFFSCNDEYLLLDNLIIDSPKFLK